MTSNLTILNSSTNNSRDMYWNDDPDPKVIGYNLYRSYDSPSNWSLLTPYPIPGHFFRDKTTLTSVSYTVQPSDWVSFGGDGQWVIQAPDFPLWSDIVNGRATIAQNPDDVMLTINGSPIRVGRVGGQDGLIYMTNFDPLPMNGSTNSAPSNPFLGMSEVPDGTSVVITYKKLTNFVDTFMGVNRVYYTVVPVLNTGLEKYTPGAVGTDVVNSMEVDRIDYMQAEMVRRNAWIFEQAGEPAHLLIRMTKGVVCQCTVPNGEPRTGCPSCYETGIVGGYYGPFDILFIDPDSAATRTLDEGGVKVERASKSYLGRTPIVTSGDLICRKNGDRMVIHDVVYKSPRGVLLQQDFDVNLLQRKDTRYLIPLNLNDPTTLYDPRFSDPQPLNEPLTDPVTDPTKTWENQIETPKGRTVTFGNIMT